MHLPLLIHKSNCWRTFLGEKHCSVLNFSAGVAATVVVRKRSFYFFIHVYLLVSFDLSLQELLFSLKEELKTKTKPFCVFSLISVHRIQTPKLSKRTPRQCKTCVHFRCKPFFQSN